MASKEPLRRCVRCKTKKKGCSRGSPCERCALAGLTAAECIYLESDTTYRTTPKRKDKIALAPKVASTKIPRSISSNGHDPNAIVRCSRCIRTARGCSHERPCQPCREHGLSEWECKYTSASSFKVRGPGSRGLRKIQSLEKMPSIAVFSTSHQHELERIQKQVRSHSTNSAPTMQTRAIIEQIPFDYRSPSPPTNISPISEPDNWRDRDLSLSPVEHEPTLFSALRPRETLAAPMPDATIRAIQRSVGATSPEHSTTRMHYTDEPPPSMALIPSISQQSHANTIPDSSPAVYTDDYQSSPSPYNSPQFQSSPPVQFQNVQTFSRPSSFTTDAPLFSAQTQVVYRPPNGYSMQPASRQLNIPHTQRGFAIPHGQQSQPQPQPQYQHQQIMGFSQSPVYQQQMLHSTSAPQYAQNHGSFSPSPRHRMIPTPSPRYASPGPYSIPTRGNSYQAHPHPHDGRQSHSGSYSSQQAIPIRRKNTSQQGFGSYTSYGASPNDPSTPDSFPGFHALTHLSRSVPGKEVVSNREDATTSVSNLDLVEPDTTIGQDEIFEWQEGTE